LLIGGPVAQRSRYPLQIGMYRIIPAAALAHLSGPLPVCQVGYCSYGTLVFNRHFLSL